METLSCNCFYPIWNVLPKLWHMRFKPASPGFRCVWVWDKLTGSPENRRTERKNKKSPPVLAKETSTRCAMPCVCVCECVGVYTHICTVCWCVLFRLAVSMGEDRDIWRGGREELHFAHVSVLLQPLCSSSSVFIVRFLFFLIKFCLKFVHVCQLLLLSLSSLNVLRQIIFFLGLYLLFYFAFFIVVCFYVFYLCTTLTEIRYTSPKFSYAFYKGLALDIMLV